MQLSWPGNYEAIRAKVAPRRVASASPACRQRVVSASPRTVPMRRLQVGSVDLCSDPDAVCSDAKVAAASRSST